MSAPPELPKTNRVAGSSHAPGAGAWSHRKSAAARGTRRVGPQRGQVSPEPRGRLGRGGARRLLSTYSVLPFANVVSPSKDPTKLTP